MRVPNPNASRIDKPGKKTSGEMAIASIFPQPPKHTPHHLALRIALGLIKYRR